MNNKVFEKAMGIKREHYSVGRNDYPDNDIVSGMWSAWQASRNAALDEAIAVVDSYQVCGSVADEIRALKEGEES